MANNLSMFVYILRLGEAEFKGCGLSDLVEDISGQANVHYMVYVLVARSVVRSRNKKQS